jgi:peptidoglycan hydrolase-like protein with peptidoglycan-binding domain
VSATPECRPLATLAAAAALMAACGGQPAAQSGAAVSTATAQVVRTDVVSRQRLTGTLTYVGSNTIINQATGIFTSLPAAGSVLGRGQVVYRVDDRSIPLLYGNPDWRALAVGVHDGPDVQQLEQNLLALGFATASNLIANGHFDAYDAAAVRRWQASLGLAQTGALNLGDVVYEPGPIRVASVQAATATFAQPGQPVFDATTLQRAVLVQLDVSQEQLVKVHDAVSVQLPDGKTAAGSISSVGAVAVAVGSPGGQSSGPPTATVTVTITLSDTAAGGAFDQAPVDIDVTAAVHRGVLAVPVMALLAEPGGKYAVEVVSGSERRAIPVTTGLFDDRGLVEVSGPDLHEGMSVEVPQG